MRVVREEACEAHRHPPHDALAASIPMVAATGSTTKITCTQMWQSISMAFVVANCEPCRIRPKPGLTFFGAIIYALRTGDDHSLS
jgi:hypothetical protein